MGRKMGEKSVKTMAELAEKHVGNRVKTAKKVAEKQLDLLPKSKEKQPETGPKKGIGRGISMKKKRRMVGRLPTITIDETARLDLKKRTDAVCLLLEKQVENCGGEARLFLRIITQAVADMCPKKCGNLDMFGEYYDYSGSAREFFTSGRHARFCELIGLDPEYVLRVLRAAGLLNRR